MPGLEGESASDRLVADLARWAAGERAAEAAAGRARARSLADQAAATASWTGVLVDLAETGAEVVMTAGPARVAGRLVGAGRDFAVVEQASGRPVLVRSDRAGSVTTAPGAPAALAANPGGNRRPHLDLGFLAVLEMLAGERAPVSITTGSGPVEGRVQALGEDLVVLRSPAGRVAYIRLDTVLCCELR